MTRNRNAPPSLPSREALLRYLSENPGPLNKRAIARAFGIKGQDRVALRQILRALAEDGAVDKPKGKTFAAKGSLPATLLIQILGPDTDGELRAKPAAWTEQAAPPPICVVGDRPGGHDLIPGSRAMARLRLCDDGTYEARILKIMADDAVTQVVGLYKTRKGGGVVTPTDKKNREEYFIPQGQAMNAADGDLVVAEPLPPGPGRSRGANTARVVERLGAKDDPRLISLIAIHSHGIPTVFSKEVLDETAAMAEPTLTPGRVDLRALPLVTIDGADARDFDDAVFAEPDTDPKNPGGWRLIVAIADVSYYVRPGSPLDRSAFDRGNSTYFADRVVPMLPERLSNDLCSLRPAVDRACLAADMRIDAQAKLISYKFVRGLMRSAARLTYEQIQAARDGQEDSATAPLRAAVTEPLYKAYALLKKARVERGALEIDLPERKAVIDATGKITAIVPRQRLDSHQLVEEFMILANVAAACALEDKNAPCVYRVHAPPAYDRLEATRDFLKDFGYSLPKAEALHPRNINNILRLSAAKEEKDLIHTVLLRTQSQAVYSPENIGHFGLALERYGHFTSPIRRYADLLVHRSLTRAFGLGAGGLTDEEAGDLAAAAEHISFTERRSMTAERDVMDRFTAQYLTDSLGQTFAGRISGVTRFGLFVSLNETGADGLVPMRSLPGDFYVHDEKRHALVGKKSGRVFRLADPVVVRVVEADALRGSTVFEIVDGGREGDKPFLSRGRDRRDSQKHRRGGDKKSGGPKGGKRRRDR